MAGHTYKRYGEAGDRVILSSYQSGRNSIWLTQTLCHLIVAKCLSELNSLPYVIRIQYHAAQIYMHSCTYLFDWTDPIQ